MLVMSFLEAEILAFLGRATFSSVYSSSMVYKDILPFLATLSLLPMLVVAPYKPWYIAFAAYSV